MTPDLKRFKLCFEVDDIHITTIQTSVRPAIGEEWVIPSLGQQSMILKVLGIRVVPPPQGDECLMFCQCEVVKKQNLFA